MSVRRNTPVQTLVSLYKDYLLAQEELLSVTGAQIP